MKLVQVVSNMFFADGGVETPAVGYFSFETDV